MSVIAVRDGIIAADSCIRADKVKFSCRKLLRLGDVAIGWSGNRLDGKTFAQWYFAGADRKEMPVFHNRANEAPEFSALVLTREGWEEWTEWMVPDYQNESHLPYTAIGSGSQAAMAAMFLGHNAQDAVRAACTVASDCEGPVVWHEIQQA